MYKLNVLGRIRSATSKKFVVAGVFALALVSAISLGMATKQFAGAATPRDCSVNSVDYKDLNGGCGAATPAELVSDIRQNSPSDLQTTYSAFGLSPDKYDRFANTAQQGIAKPNGDVVVNNQVVMTGAWSIGRTAFSYSTPMQIGGTTFYRSDHTRVLRGVDHDVMVMFDANGTAEAAVLNACGNAVNGNKVPSSASCKALNMTAVSGKANTYSFTTTTAVSGNATIAKVVYTFSDGTSVTKTNPSDAVVKTFAKSGTAKVQVYVTLPGNQTKVITAATCEKTITVTPPPATPMCTVPGKEQYPKDSPLCKEDMCTVPGHETLPKNSPDCKTDNCTVPGHENLPKNSDQCVVPPAPTTPTTPAPPAVLADTGMGDVFGLFAGTSATGAIVHRVISTRRRR